MTDATDALARALEQEAIMGMSPDDVIPTLRQMIESARERNDPTISIALSVEALAFLLDRLEKVQAALDDLAALVIGEAEHD